MDLLRSIARCEEVLDRAESSAFFSDQLKALMIAQVPPIKDIE